MNVWIKFYPNVLFLLFFPSPFLFLILITRMYKEGRVFAVSLVISILGCGEQAQQQSTFLPRGILPNQGSQFLLSGESEEKGF